MQTVEEVSNWLKENESKVEYGEIYVIIRKHQGEVTETRKVIVHKGKCDKKDESILDNRTKE